MAETCSALPAAGSIYLWAAESGGRRYGRLFAFLVAWWSITAWTSFVAANSQAAANFLLSEITIFGLDFPTSPDDIKFRALQWIVSETFLFISIGMNYLSSNSYKWIFRFSTFIILLDFLLNVIWLPIGVSKSYGFQDSSFVFLQTYNQTGAPPAWNWMLSYFVTAGLLVGFEAPGHISEETKNASLTAARGIFSSVIVSGSLGFFVVLLFLYCTPDLSTLYSFASPQPFTSLYALTLGQGGHVVMTVVCILGLVANTTVAGVASSRLIWAVARDGVLPGSEWVCTVTDKQQPRNAVTLMLAVSAALLCTILPSPVAFTSLVSASAVPNVCAYALICCKPYHDLIICLDQGLTRIVGRSFLTPHTFPTARWSLGRFSRPMAIISTFWNIYLAAVLFSPLEFPVTASNFNYSPVIFGGITILAILSWYVTPEGRWLPNERLGRLRKDRVATNGPCLAQM